MVGSPDQPHKALYFPLSPAAVSSNNQIRKFDYSYDAVNRLTAADFNQYTGSFNKNAGIDFSVSGLTYDANGNILSMQQKGWKATASVTIDNLVYNYMPNSNKLLNVIDAANEATTKLGDFRTSTLHPNSGSKNSSTVDYTYDVNGNMVKDHNKDILSYTGANGIEYNHLNLPSKIYVKKDGSSNKGTIEYVYDAGGNKLKKIVTEGSLVTTTLYMGGAVYRNDTLEFIGTEEGRLRYNVYKNKLFYDYFVKDHLGNVRMVLTEERDTSIYPQVAFEDATTSNEQIYYEKANDQRTTRPEPFYTSTTNGSKVQLLRKSTQSIGVGKLLKVMAKDRLHVKVDYYAVNETTDNSGANGQDALITILTSLLNSNPVTATMHGSGSTITGNLNNATAFTNFVSPQNGSGGTSMPKAYLNIVFFDEQFRFVGTNSEIIQITTKGSGQTITRIDGSAKEAPKNGYVYIYVSNESNNMVYFDNFQVKHEKGPITEETHYYPFGLTMAGISSKAATSMDNKFEYNGKELQSKEFSDGSGLEIYDFHARQQDPQIGRWTSVDPLADKFSHQSPYVAMDNNPINIIDPTGMSGTSTHTDKNGKVIAVYDDGDLGVYKHGDNANGKAPTEANIDNRHKKSTSAGGEKMGETENWDEFISPETGKTLTETTIQFGKSFDPIISEMHEKAKDMDLKEIALASRGGGQFDIKKDYKNVGGLLNGKYATSRSAGNFLAGYNAEGATYLGLSISFTTFQKLAGALHIEESAGAKLGKGQMADIVISGHYKSADPDKHKKFVAPTYGEINYQYRMSLSGWNFGKKK